MESQGAADRSATFFSLFFSLVGSREEKNKKGKGRAEFIQIFIDPNSRHYANFQTNLRSIGVSVQLAFQQMEECPYSTSGVGKFRKGRKRKRKRKLPPPCQLQAHSTNCYSGKFPRNGNKKHKKKKKKKRASCKIANANSVIRKFCLRHHLSQVHFLVEKADGSIRFCQKQINARRSVTHGNQLVLENFSCDVHDDELKNLKK
ncbi:hypothetical protein T01_5349 [Trichinella spiralis]|uniref:Uncharacterized protein n=1 Tax=Trichinella spiralis TaxID=6334 RepID=A0A0V1B695_TRISP|nr:hypothetical protein T01_5349 [Trichinella spiralis]